jgi:8-oxo-dGTP diphosphatase
MKSMNVSQFFQSAFSVDNVIFGFDEGDLKILLVKRGEEPYNNMWALPGELVFPHENLDEAADRVLKQLTGLEKVYLEQVQTFGTPNRHPLGRVITIAYFSLIKIDDFELAPSLWAKKAQWHSLSKVGHLAFDHNEILEACFQKLKRRVRVQPIGFELLPPKFTLTELQHLYEAILQSNPEKGIDKRNFRKKILAMDILVDCDELQEGVAHRPAKLYAFDKIRYESFVESGYAFEV